MNTLKADAKSTNLVNLLFLSLLVLFVGAAIPYLDPVTPRVNSDLLAFTGLGLFGLLTCFSLPQNSSDLSLNSLGILSGAWLLWACVQYIAGIHTASFSYFLISISYLAAVILLSICVSMWIQAGQGQLLANAVMWAVLVAGLVQALAIWLQMFQLNEILSPWLNRSASFPRHGGFLGQPNLCATLMVSAMVCLVFVNLKEGQASASPQAWRLVAMAVMMLAIFATSSRTGYLEVLLVSGVLALVRRRLAISWVWVSLIVWQLLAIGLGEILVSNGLISSQLLGDSRQAVEASGNHRLRILKDAWLVIQHHPLMGVGWRQLQVAQVLTPGIEDPVDHAHNIFVQAQVELGILGSVSLLVFVGFWLFKNKPWRAAKGYQIAMFSIALILAFHSMLEYPLWQALFLFLLAFAVSLLPSQAYAFRLPLGLLKAIYCVLLLVTAWFFVDYQQSLKVYSLSMQQPKTSVLVEAHKNVWWNHLLFDSVMMVNTPVDDTTRPILRKIAKENANIFDQTKFLNLPLLKITIQDGQTAVANQLAHRMCMSFPKELWAAVQQHLLELKDPRYTAWLDQLPTDSRACKE
jgi:O-antigen ligase